MASTFDLEGWALIPAPEDLTEVGHSEELDEIPRYAAEAVARRLAGHTEVAAPDARADWWDWKATWSSGGKDVEVGFTLLDDVDGPATWGGSPLSGTCDVDAFLRLWRQIREAFPGVCLHSPDLDVHTPETFTELLEDV